MILKILAVSYLGSWNPLSKFSNQSLLCRTRRRQAREQTGQMADHLEGLSSDDEETSTDITNFNLEKG